MTDQSASFDAQYTLDDRYARSSGRVLLTGVQALVRLPLMQHARDRAEGLTTAGFISGYRGSPLGTYDLALWQAKPFLEAAELHFEPGVNEDLAATAVWGSQQANLHERPRYDGVFGIWYGKGPGVDRACDALKHGNYAGSAAKGGVLVLTGDDPAARSSSIAHQSEQALIHCGIPVLNPADVQDYLDLGLYGFALSRYSGCWVGFKCLTDTVDSARSVAVDVDRVQVRLPADFEMPEAGLNIGWGNLPLAVEQRLYEQRLRAAQAFVRVNELDRTVVDAPRRRLGIVTTGKAYLDLRQALEELGIDEAAAAELGLSIYKVAMVWPLEPEGARRFARGLEEILVVEEKRPILEDQLTALLYNAAEAPRIFGKLDENGAPLVPGVGELSPSLVVEILRAWLSCRAPEFARRLPAAPPEHAAPGASTLTRLPSFCSGCPHNLSTVVPEQSVALGGIGCHGMAVWLPGRRTLAVTQMGGEGANWIGQAPFTETAHIFQNLGDGTYFHSGLLAIRAAVTAGVNITYKILVNGAIAMTGGQPIEGERIEGEFTTPDIVRQLLAEGVGSVEVVSDDVAKYPRGAIPPGVGVHARRELDRVQRRLREVPGVTAIVYDQVCAAEARRLRKRGEWDDPDRRIVINERVCEGCGDCNVVSNCISVEPLETEFGRKRTINQSSCNKDYACADGYCPSFVSVIGGTLRKQSDGLDRGGDELFRDLPDPPRADTETPYNLLVTGIGGTGVVTVGALIGMAAHLEGRGVSALDVTGLAQKNGPVTSHVRVADDPEALHATRIARGATDLVLGCDIVVTASADALALLSPGRTAAVVSDRVAPTGDFASAPDLDLSSAGMADAIGAAVAPEGMDLIPAARLATALLGDSIAANLFLVGYALQRGRIPVGLAALERAIELNGRAVDMNRRALAWGRLFAHDPDAVRRIVDPEASHTESPSTPDLDGLVARRVEFLQDYQNAAYAQRYRDFVDSVAGAERELGNGSTALAEAVARYHFKLMAYKDEYEVARLYTDGVFRRSVEREFEGAFRLRLHLAPQLFFPRDRDTGRVRKVTLGAWAFWGLGLLARLRFLRGTPLDVFGYMKQRRLERRLIDEYEATIRQLLSGLSAQNHELAVEIARIPEYVRGFDLVKDEQLAAAREKEASLLAEFRLRASHPAVDPV